jgi:hypothetical protein
LYAVNPKLALELAADIAEGILFDEGGIDETGEGSTLGRESAPLSKTRDAPEHPHGQMRLV